MQLATGDFIFHVDADDYIEPDAIASLVCKQISTGADLVVANYLLETEEKTTAVRYCDASKSQEDIVKESNDTSLSILRVMGMR